jgi:hypothetical protein
VSELFGRSCRVQIDDVIVECINTTDSGVELGGLRVSGRVEKTDDGKPNKLELNVYNLAQKTRDRLGKTKVSVVVEAGYQKELSLIFKGDLRRVAHPKEGPDVVTKVSSGDGDVVLRGTRFSGNFAANMKVSDLLVKMVESFGVSSEQAKQRIRRGDFRGGIQELTKGFNFSGPLQQEFDRRMKDAGLEWSIQNGELQVLGEKETLQTTALKISPSSGLIGSPDLGEKDTIKFLTLLQASIAPGRKVVLESQSKSGTFKVTKCVHRFDTHGSDWFTECEAKSL